MSYSNLEAGDYIFKLESANQDNIWNAEPVELAVKVHPPIWKTWWMYIIYCLFIITALPLIHSFFWFLLLLTFWLCFVKLTWRAYKVYQISSL